MNNIYDTLLQIPVFQGLSKERFEEIIGNTRFDFLKYPAGEQLAWENDEYTNIKFIISGSIRTELNNSSRKIKIIETLPAPNVLVPNRLFGKATFFPLSVFAEEDTGIMQLDKQIFIELMQAEKIVLLNFINNISYRSQKGAEAFTNISSSNIKARFAFWILYFSSPKSRDIKIISKQKDLYSWFGVQRSIFINMLDEMKQEEILDYSVREINIINRNKLNSYYTKLLW
ncbi:MAG: Crp/Fnr family transcriptional regulator [Bacteroidales bacterium]